MMTDCVVIDVFVAVQPNINILYFIQFFFVVVIQLFSGGDE